MRSLIKSILMLIVVGVILKFTFTYLPLERFQQFKTKSTDLSQERVGKYQLGDSMSSLSVKTNQFDRAADGKNMKYSYDGGGDKDFNYINLIDGIIAVSKEKDGIDEILGYMVYTNKVSTNKGISLGSSQEAIINAYGDNYYVIRKPGEDFIGYVDKDNKITLRFRLNNNKLVRFDLNYIEANKALNL